MRDGDFENLVTLKTQWLANFCAIAVKCDGNGTRCLGLQLSRGDMKSLEVKVCVSVFLAKVEREASKEKSHFWIYIVKWQWIVAVTHRCYGTQVAKGKQNYPWWREFLLLRLEVKTNEIVQSVRFSLPVWDCSLLQTSILPICKYAKEWLSCHSWLKWQMYLCHSQIYYKVVSVQRTVTPVSVRLSLPVSGGDLSGGGSSIWASKSRFCCVTIQGSCHSLLRKPCQEKEESSVGMDSNLSLRLSFPPLPRVNRSKHHRITLQVQCSAIQKTVSDVVSCCGFQCRWLPCKHLHLANF